MTLLERRRWLLNLIKWIKKTISGTVVSINDVSSNAHELGVKLTSDTVTDFSTVEVTRIGKNWFDLNKLIEPSSTAAIENLVKDIEKNSFSFATKKTNTSANIKCDVFLPVGTYRISGISSSTSGLKCGVYITDSNNKILVNNAGTSCNANFKVETAGVYYFRFYKPYSDKVGDITTYKNVQIECGSVATEYEPFKESQTVTTNADGIVEGLTSLSPNTTLYSNNDAVVINCEYYADVE